MNDNNRSRFQIDASKETRDHAKSLAYAQGQTLTEFVLKAMAEYGDKKLRSLIEADLSDRQKGRPATKK